MIVVLNIWTLLRKLVVICQICLTCVFFQNRSWYEMEKIFLKHCVNVWCEFSNNLKGSNTAARLPVLTMVYNNQNRWLCGFCPSPGILNTIKHNVSETGCVFVFTGPLQWLKLALSKGPSRVGTSLPSPEDRNISSFRNVVFSSI
jgi:hypothetical protein